MSSHTLSIRLFWSFLFSLIQRHWKQILLIQLLYLGWSLDRSVLPYLVGKIIDGITQYTGSRTEAWHFLGQPILFTLSAWIGFDLSFRIGGLLFAKLIHPLDELRILAQDKGEHLLEKQLYDLLKKFLQAVESQHTYILLHGMGPPTPISPQELEKLTKDISSLTPRTLWESTRAYFRINFGAVLDN